MNALVIDRDYCISSYLTLRYVARPDVAWQAGIVPTPPDPGSHGRIGVRSAADIVAALRDLVDEVCRHRRVGVLLSSGIDSAIMAALVPTGTPSFTIRFDAPGVVDESGPAREVARRLALPHSVVTATWHDHVDSLDSLMRRKRAPLHPVEVGLFMASTAAARDGLDTLLVGNGADSTFGGLDRLLARDWTFDEFVQRYTFLDPARAVRRASSVAHAYEPYRRGTGIDILGFLKTVHGLGIQQAFDNAVSAGGCTVVSPFEALALDVPLDLARIRKGDPKYLLREVFQSLFPGLPVPPKVAFVRPLSAWLSEWDGPRRPEFLSPLDMAEFTGEQRWQMYCLQRFLDLLDNW